MNISKIEFIGINKDQVKKHLVRLVNVKSFKSRKKQVFTIVKTLNLFNISNKEYYEYLQYLLKHYNISLVSKEEFNTARTYLTKTASRKLKLENFLFVDDIKQDDLGLPLNLIPPLMRVFYNLYPCLE